jgi:hypothetical protein
MAAKDKKIHTDDDGKQFTALVPAALGRWMEGKSAEEIGRYFKWLRGRCEAGDEEALKTVPFLATQEHIDAWEEGHSVSEHDQ